MILKVRDAGIRKELLKGSAFYEVTDGTIATYDIGKGEIEAEEEAAKNLYT